MQMHPNVHGIMDMSMKRFNCTTHWSHHRCAPAAYQDAGGPVNFGYGQELFPKTGKITNRKFKGEDGRRFEATEA